VAVVVAAGAVVAPRRADPVAGGPGGGGGRGNGTTSLSPDDDWPQAYNWNTPIRLSVHNPSTVLIGGTRFFVSRDRGNTWAMSKPLGQKIDPASKTLLEKPYKLPSCGARPAGMHPVEERRSRRE
jgi:hypothetical protein